MDFGFILSIIGQAITVEIIVEIIQYLVTVVVKNTWHTELASLETSLMKNVIETIGIMVLLLSGFSMLSTVLMTLVFAYGFPALQRYLF